MSKTKFIQVSGKERPEEAGTYNTSHGILNYSKALDEFLNEKGESVLIESWFLEVPDREEEMRVMLEEILNHVRSFPFDGIPSKMYRKIEQLLNK